MASYERISFKGTQDEINAQWLEYRKNGIGGSEASSILGFNPYSSPLDVWLEKTGRSEHEDISDKPSVYWGNVLEDVVATEFKKRHPEFTVREPKAMFVSKRHRFMFASCDRLVFDRPRARRPHAILEIKTAGAYRADDWADGVPDYYLPQVVHYMAVLDADLAYVAVLIGGSDYREYVVKRDEEDIRALIEAEEAFWNYVETDTMPELVGGAAADSESDALLGIYAESTGDMPFMDAGFEELCAAYRNVQKDEEALKQTKRELGNAIKSRIGEAKGAVGDCFKVTWSRGETSRFDSKRFIAENADLASEYMETTVRDGGIRVKEI